MANGHGNWLRTEKGVLLNLAHVQRIYVQNLHNGEYVILAAYGRNGTTVDLSVHSSEDAAQTMLEAIWEQL